MACYSPMIGYRSKTVNQSGKRSIVFKMSEGLASTEKEVPCGGCIGCRLKDSRQWAIRCMHEASLHSKNCFITLTYEDVPVDGSLDKNHFAGFMKRLRERFPRDLDDVIRVFHCGEYGEKFLRPHYHGLLFNFDFEDRIFWREKNGVPLYRSKILEEVWQGGRRKQFEGKRGFCTVGNLTMESAA